MFLWTTLPALRVTATPLLLLHGGGRGWEAEGTRGSAVPNALLLSETCLNSPQRLLWVVYTFWLSVVAFSFYTRTVCGLVDPAGAEQLNLHVHFSEKGLCFTTEGSVSFPWLLTKRKPATQSQTALPQQVLVCSLRENKQRNHLKHHGWISFQVKKDLKDYDTVE